MLQVFGAEQLLKRTSAEPLALTKLFSSLAAFSGSGGQGSYASANGVLDSWAAIAQARISQRMGRHLPVADHRISLSSGSNRIVPKHVLDLLHDNLQNHIP